MVNHIWDSPEVGQNSPETQESQPSSAEAVIQSSVSLSDQAFSLSVCESKNAEGEASFTVILSQPESELFKMKLEGNPIYFDHKDLVGIMGISFFRNISQSVRILEWYGKRWLALGTVRSNV